MSYRLLVRALSQSNSVLLFLQKRLVRRIASNFLRNHRSTDTKGNCPPRSYVDRTGLGQKSGQLLPLSTRERPVFFSLLFSFFLRGKNSTQTIETREPFLLVVIGEARWRIIEFSCVLTKPCLVVKYYHVPWRKIAITLSTE